MSQESRELLRSQVAIVSAAFCIVAALLLLVVAHDWMGALLCAALSLVGLSTFRDARAALKRASGDSE
jgi:hypothetical protein